MVRYLKGLKSVTLSITILIYLIQPVEAKFINTFLYRIGGSWTALRR